MPNILKMGHPLLNKTCQKVTEFNTPELDALVQALLEIQHQCEGAGMSAPQIGVDKQVMSFGGITSRYIESAGMPDAQVLINPSFRLTSNVMINGWEGCISVPGLRGLVSRYKDIIYSGYDINGNLVEGVATGFLARVMQHECDHLNGVLFPQRIKDFRCFGFEEELLCEAVV